MCIAPIDPFIRIAFSLASIDNFHRFHNKKTRPSSFCSIDSRSYVKTEKALQLQN